MIVSRVRRAWRRLLRRIDGAVANSMHTGHRRTAIFAWHLLSRLSPRTSLVTQSDRLATTGDAAAALATLRAGLFMGRQTRAAAREAYWMHCRWLARAGFLHEAEQHLASLDANPLTRKLSRRRRLQLWSRFAVFDPRIRSHLYDWLPLVSTPDLAASVLRTLYHLDGPTGRLVEAYANTWQRLGRKGNDADFRCDWWAVATHPDAIAPSPPQIALPTDWPARCALDVERYLLASDALSASAFEREQASEFVNAIGVGTEVIWSALSDPAVRVAVVGNARTGLGLAQGAHIDAHDLVVRFNVPATAPDQIPDYGARVDIHVINQAVLNEPRVQALSDTRILITGPDWACFSFAKPAVKKLLARGCQIGVVPRAVTTSLATRLYASASSGLQFTAALAEARGGSAAGVSFHGFAYTDQIGRDAVSSNYFRTSRPVQRHNWAGEALVFSALRAGENIASVPVDTLARLRYTNGVGELSAYRPLRFCIEGDHSRYHCGSAAVIRQLRDCLLPHGAIAHPDDDYDTLIVNGEGSMHHDSAHCREKMAAIERALQAGRQVYLVNSVWQDNSSAYDSILPRIDRIWVREVKSQQQLLDRHGISAEVYPDLAYYCTLEPRARRTDFHGAVVLTDFWSSTFGTFVRWTGAEGLKLPYIDMRRWNWSDLVASLASAELLVTGRHHAVYAACRARVPFIAFAGNTHKIEGLIESAGVDIPLCPGRDALPEHLEHARANRAEYEKLFNWLDAFPTWNPVV